MNERELRAAIARNGLSAPKLAKRIGINKKTIYKKMRGETQFTQKEISAIAEQLHLTDDDLLAIFFCKISFLKETRR